MFTNLNFTDIETCYKLFSREVIQGLIIEEDRFGFEPEITAKIAHRSLVMTEYTWGRIEALYRQTVTASSTVGTLT